MYVIGDFVVVMKVLEVVSNVVSSPYRLRVFAG